VLLVTGSPEVHRHEMPPGVDYIKLPSLRKVGVDEYAPRTLAMSSEGIQTLRSELLLRTIRDYEPNVLLVDHAPVGSRGELRSALEWLARRGGCTRILGLRDIIDEPSAVIESWRGGGIYEVLDQLYDHIAVYGARDFFDPIEKYEMPTAVAAKVRFVGYVTDAQSRVDDPYVAVSIGGGDGGGPEVIGTLLEMMRRYRDRIDFRARILTGPFLESELAERFRAEARGLPVEIESFIPSTAALFRGAEVVISTAGYNTTTDILAFARRAVIIPRVLHRQEQLLRARRLEEWGLVRCLAPGEVTPESLFEAIASVRRDGGGALSESRAQQRLPLDGADRFAEFCGGLEVVVQETSSAAVSR
jgi:predicted glycosyltransferase